MAKPRSPVRREQDRVEFLRHAQSIKPELLASLAKRLSEWSDLDRRRAEVESMPEGDERTHAQGALFNARGGLVHDWAESHGLSGASWVYQIARRQLTFWRCEREQGREPMLEWAASAANCWYRMPTPEPALLRIAWSPGMETAADFVARVAEEAKAAAQSHVEWTEAKLATSRYWPVLPEPRGDGPKRHPQGLLWLAERVIGGLSYYRISQKHGATQSAVEKAVKAAGVRIELALAVPATVKRPKPSS